MLKSKNAKLIVVGAALAVCLIIATWSLLGGSSAASDERANQERLKREMPAVNESTPRSAKPAAGPR